jgi:hypothetical protein
MTGIDRTTAGQPRTNGVRALEALQGCQRGHAHEQSRQRLHPPGDRAAHLTRECLCEARVVATVSALNMTK